MNQYESDLKKDFDQFAMKRCEVALMGNAAYVNAERSGEVPQEEIQAKAEELCYKQGFNDAMQIIKGKLI